MRLIVPSSPVPDQQTDLVRGLTDNGEIDDLVAGEIACTIEFASSPTWICPFAKAVNGPLQLPLKRCTLGVDCGDRVGDRKVVHAVAVEVGHRQGIDFVRPDRQARSARW